MKKHMTPYKNQFCCAILVELVDGLQTNEGNVHATNPATGLYGPVCDNNWDINDVS